MPDSTPPDHHRPTPAGLLIEALRPSSYADYDTITAVVDRLGVDLTDHLTHLIRSAIVREVGLALRRATVDATAELPLGQIPDAVAQDARARLGYRSAPLTAGELVDHEDQAARYVESAAGPGWAPTDEIGGVPV